MSVEYFDALSNVSVSPRVNQQLLSDCAPQVSEIIGEAARMVMPGLMSVNLLPRHIVEETAFAKTRPLMIMGAAVLFAATPAADVPVLEVGCPAGGCRQKIPVHDASD